MGYKFAKLDRKYPLTRFRAFLFDGRGLTSRNVVDHYLSALRKALAAVEGRWKDFDAILDHFAELETRQQDLLQAVWVHWLAFTGARLPRLGLGPRTRRGPLGEALRRLMPALEGWNARYPGFVSKDVLGFVWRWQEPHWRVEGTGRSGKTTLIWRELEYWPALRVVRLWGYPGTSPGADDGCRDGVLFLPRDPHSDAPMNEATLYRTLNKRTDGATELQLDRELQQLQESESRRLQELVASRQGSLTVNDLRVAEGGIEADERIPPTTILEP